MKTSVSSGRWQKYTKQKEEFPPDVGTYILTKAEVSSGRWELYKKRKQKFPPDIGIYKRKENRPFLRTLAHIYQTKVGVSSVHWHIYTKPEQEFPPGVGTYIRKESTRFFRTLATIYQTKAAVSYRRWFLSTKPHTNSGQSNCLNIHCCDVLKLQYRQYRFVFGSKRFRFRPKVQLFLDSVGPQSLQIKITLFRIGSRPALHIASNLSLY